MIDLNNPAYFINRELSWLRFNLRVLRESGMKHLPLLERLRFVAITASNMDEFFMVRVAGLYNQMENGINAKDAAGLTAEEQLKQIAQAAHMQMKAKYRYLHSILKELRNHDIYLRHIDEVEEKGKVWLEEYYSETIYPVLTPMAVDASRPFPFLMNKTLNLAIELINNEKELSRGFVQVPSVLPRIIEVGNCEKRTFVFLEEVIIKHCEDLFKGCEILNVVPFRITRDSDLDVDEEDTDDLLKEIELSLRKRKRGASVRLEILKTRNNQSLKKFLAENFFLEEEAIYEIAGPLDATCFFKFINMFEQPELLFSPFVPQQPAELIDLDEEDSLFDFIRADDILLHHPYESFDPVIKLVNDAASDPKVLAIKQTLYRVSGNSPIVAALAKAAENGKQVTVLVELKARFDEENNIIWAKRLEKAGCHVIYGLVGLKTHAKIILIVRKETDGIKRYVHLGTGNYNDNTARLYTDMGLMTASDQFGIDASAFFNLLSGYAEPPLWNKLVMAPLGLRQKIYELIDNE
ncbi:MAG TPA: polyphosphate kinase 1, partial [Candidatus Avacidaminococcus intestinavium]|nr:polyphosphate kinase 1 [Candidatus Avacidaminococcus intestinavium]